MPTQKPLKVAVKPKAKKKEEPKKKAQSPPRPRPVRAGEGGVRCGCRPDGRGYRAPARAWRDAGQRDDVDPEEAADEAAAAVEIDPDAVEDEIEEEAIAERKEVKDLLAAGREKGYSRTTRSTTRCLRTSCRRTRSTT